jgi:predicted enzyme related to lactoylglutathione lyase
MEVEYTTIGINSTNPQRLYEWYRDTLGLPVVEGEDHGPTALNAGGTIVSFGEHSEITGPTKEPARHLTSLFVADIDKEQERLVAAGAQCVRDRGREFWGGIISTFVDPDGNYIQLIQYHPGKAQMPEPAAAGQPA